MVNWKTLWLIYFSINLPFLFQTRPSNLEKCINSPSVFSKLPVAETPAGSALLILFLCGIQFYRSYIQNAKQDSQRWGANAPSSKPSQPTASQWTPFSRCLRETPCWTNQSGLLAAPVRIEDWRKQAMRGDLWVLCRVNQHSSNSSCPIKSRFCVLK